MAEQSKDTMDDIFGAPIGPAKGAKPMPTTPQAEKGVSGVGLTAGEERAGAAAVGAMLGPRVQRGLEAALSLGRPSTRPHDDRFPKKQSSRRNGG